MGNAGIRVYDEVAIIAGIQLSLEHDKYNMSHDWRDVQKALIERGIPKERTYGPPYQVFCNDNHANDLYFGKILLSVSRNKGVDITESRFEKQLKEVSNDLPDPKIFLVHSYITVVLPP